jgi:hypothetical protein
MANSDKNILITPNIGSTTADPVITFSGADASVGPQNINLRVYPTSNGTLSFEGSVGQLFSITNDLSGVIYSVNDVSGIPSIEVLDTGLVKLAQYSGNVLIGTETDSGAAKLQVNGVASATDFNSLSDQTKKKDIKVIQNAVETIKQIEGVSFVWIENDKKSYGVIAQQLENILPNVVNTDVNGIKTVNYNSLTAFFIEAIKEQQNQIDDLKREISNLK